MIYHKKLLQRLEYELSMCEAEELAAKLKKEQNKD